MSDNEKLLEAIQAGSPEQLKKLLDDGVNDTVLQGRLIEAAIQKGNADIMRALLDAGVDVNATYNECDLDVDDGSTALHMAACKGDADMVKLLLSLGADIHARDICRHTPLHVAVSASDTRTAKMLIAGKADVNAQREDGQTPLHIAALGRVGDSAGITKALIKAQADVNAQSCDGTTPLHIAVMRNNTWVTELLLDNNADTEIRDKLGKTALCFAAAANSPMSTSLLIEHGANINVRTNNGDMPLHYAADVGYLCNEDLIAELIEQGGMVDAVNDKGRTPLHVAAMRGTTAAIRLLHKEDANSEIRNADGKTPLAVAVEEGDLGTVKILVEEVWADLKTRSRGGDTLLHIATKHNDPDLDMISYLLDQELDPDVVNWAHSAPLQDASIQGRSMIVGFLLEAGANANTADNTQNTPLMKAVEKGHYGTAKKLLDHRADPNCRDLSGRAPLHFAVKHHDGRLCRLLIGRGANPKVANRHGNTPLGGAILGRNEYCVSLLLEAGAEAEKQDLDVLLHIYQRPLRDKHNIRHKVLSHLLQAGVDVNGVRDPRSGYNMLHAICRNPTAKIEDFRLLLKHLDKETINTTNHAGDTPLNVYLSRPPSFDRKQPVKTGVKLLLEAGANPALKNADGETALDIVRRRGFNDLEEMLKPLVTASNDELTHAETSSAAAYRA